MGQNEKAYVCAMSNGLGEMVSMLIQDVELGRWVIVNSLPFIFHVAAACGCVLSPYWFQSLLQYYLHNFLIVLKIESDFRQRSCSRED